MPQDAGVAIGAPHISPGSAQGLVLCHHMGCNGNTGQQWRHTALYLCEGPGVTRGRSLPPALPSALNEPGFRVTTKTLPAPPEQP